MVTPAASRLDEYPGTYISYSFLSSQLASWQAHLMRISSSLKHGESVWWKKEEGGVKFFHSDKDPDYHSVGPQLQHFRSTA